MNSRQQSYLKASVSSEQQTLRKLKKVYEKARDDINDKIAGLIEREKAADENTLAGIIYQRQYQEALRKQINGILDTMESEQFKTISDYVSKSYEDGFVGTMYDLHGQGIPLVIPIDERQAVKAIQTDSKISSGLYERLGEDVGVLKKSIAYNVSRGIAQNSPYIDIAKNIAGSMTGHNKKNPGGALWKAMRIARTEAHRVANTAHMDAQIKAKEKGADILKQWDATLDARTRDSHKAVDGELKKIDEEFSNGLMFPGDPDGSAAEVINCRCTLLQRAKWALGEDELQALKERAGYFGLDKSEGFEDFKKKYLNAVDKEDKSGIIKISSPISSRKHPTGNPVGVGMFGDKLNKRQQKLLEMLPEYDSKAVVHKRSVSLRDLSALTAQTNVEYAMFTKGNKRLIIRGDNKSVNIGIAKAKQLAEEGYRWSGHTHPGISQDVVFASRDDYKILKIFGQNNSVTFNSIGKFYVFGKDEIQCK